MLQGRNYLGKMCGCGLFLTIVAFMQVNGQSVVFDEPRPRLPGPSIFEYNIHAFNPHISNSDSLAAPSSADFNLGKVKRGNALAPQGREASNTNLNSITETSLEIKSPPKHKTHPLYYEMAGDELYVFEPSPLGASPFMDSLRGRPPPPNFKNLNPRNPNFLPPHPRHFGRPPPQPNFKNIKVEQIQPKDAKTVEISEAPKSEGGAECISANEKEGRCVDFKTCYPVVFNLADGSLRNVGLGRMLYQASGPCSGGNETVNVPLEIPADFSNQTVCCPGYFYFDNTTPIHFSNAQRSKSLRLRLRPSQPDPMLNLGLNPRGRDFGHSHQPPHHPRFRGKGHRLPRPLRPPPPPILLQHHELFDDSPEDENEVENEIYGNDPPDYDYELLRTNSTTTLAPEKNSTEGAESSRLEIKVNSLVGVNQKEKKEQPEKIAHNPKIVKSEAQVPVIIKPPHLSAWNCPGRTMGLQPRGHWPWMVALLNEGSHFCSGSVIDHRHVLTSASCVASFQGKDIGKMRAILGDRILYSSSDGPHTWRKIIRITRHLQFVPGSGAHDIAILELEQGVEYSPTIQPINLPPPSGYAPGPSTTRAIVSGWSGADLGKRWFSARSTSDAIVEFMDRDKCAGEYEGFRSDKEIPEGVLCTKASNSSCQADLGGPLMMKTGNCWHVIGIMSQGLGCGMFPDIYTDIAKHADWITKNIRQHFPPQDTFLKN